MLAKTPFSALSRERVLLGALHGVGAHDRDGARDSRELVGQRALRLECVGGAGRLRGDDHGHTLQRLGGALPHGSLVHDAQAVSERFALKGLAYAALRGLTAAQLVQGRHPAAQRDAAHERLLPR